MVACKSKPLTLISGIIALLFVSAAVSSPTPYSVTNNNSNLTHTGCGNKGSNENNTAVPAHPFSCCCPLCCKTKQVCNGQSRGNDSNNTVLVQPPPPAHPSYCCCTLCCKTKKCNAVNGTRPKQGQNFTYSIGVPLNDEYNYSAKGHSASTNNGIVMGGSAGVFAVPTRGFVALLAVLATFVATFT